MTDLAQRILDAIGETERIARDACGVAWTDSVTAMIHVDPAVIRDNKLAYGHLGFVASTDRSSLGDAYRRHIARNDPDTVLRRCAADRRVLSRHTTGAISLMADGRERGRLCPADHRRMPCPDLLDLADSYGITEEDSHG